MSLRGIVGGRLALLRRRVNRPVRHAGAFQLNRQARVVLVDLTRRLGLGDVGETIEFCVRQTYEQVRAPEKMRRD